MVVDEVKIEVVLEDEICHLSDSEAAAIVLGGPRLKEIFEKFGDYETKTPVQRQQQHQQHYKHKYTPIRFH